MWGYNMLHAYHKFKKYMQICHSDLQKSHLGICGCMQGLSCEDTAWNLLKHRAVILIAPDEDLCDGADGLH